MKKKCFLLMVLIGFVVGSAFALPELKLSAGGGLYFTNDFGGGFECKYEGASVTRKTPYAVGGIFGFFDATFVELSLGYALGSMTMKDEGSEFGETDYSWSCIDVSLLGKYPFGINEKITAFPLLGIDYRMSAATKWDSALWFKFGGGLDYSVTEKIYVRGEALYGVRLASEEEEGAGAFPDATDIKPLLGHGLTINVAVGYRF